MIYLKLKDYKNQDKILRFDHTTGRQELHDTQSKKWETVNIVYDYLLSYSDKFELYDEIDESEVSNYAA